MKPIKHKKYEEALEGLQAELLKLQHWITANNQRVAIIFEGRDAAGKGGVIKAIEAPLNDRFVRTVALSKPEERERTSGISSATRASCPVPANWSCSTAVGTTAPASNRSWASAPLPSTSSS